MEFILDKPLGPGFLRLMLALLVVLHHASRIHIGEAAVYTFFVLSGYWISAVWGKKYHQLPNAYRRFILARILRLAPLFMVANVFAFSVKTILSPNVATQIWQTLSTIDLINVALSNFFIAGYTWQKVQFVSVAWSLDVEVQFYLLAPIFIALARQTKVIGLAMLTCLALTAFGLGLHESILNYAGFFYLGILSQEVSWRPTKAFAQYSFWTCFVFVALLIYFPIGRENIIGGSHPGPYFKSLNIVACTSMTILLLPAIIWTTQRKSSTTDKSLGDLSYSVYLFHAPLGILYAHWFGNLPPLERLPYFLAYFAIMSTVSYIAWALIDRKAIIYHTRLNASGLS